MDAAMRRPARITALLVLAGLAASGCLGTTVEEARARRIGTDPPEGPTHNAGNDCLTCHSFAIAGTVYLRASDTEGLAGATVSITDANDRTFDAITNRTGNFYMVAGGGQIGFSIGEDGETQLGFTPAFPLRARVTSGDLEGEMITSIHRQGSCNVCHAAEPGAESVGRIFLVEP